MGELEDMKTQKNRLMALCLTVILAAGTLTGCKNIKSSRDHRAGIQRAVSDRGCILYDARGAGLSE